VIVAADLIRVATASGAAFVALIFLRALLHKTADLARFEGIVVGYRLAPVWAPSVLRYLVPGLELACALALMWTASRAVGSLFAVGLLIGYGAAMAINLLRGRTEIDCGCGGGSDRLGWALVVRNLGLAALVVPAALGLGDGASFSEALAGWAIAFVAFCSWGAAEQLMVNQARMATHRRDVLSWSIGAAL
jgi:hypothetical protein